VPPLSFETRGIWFDVPAELCRRVAEERFDVMGALHAAEHAAIAMMPLLALADRSDIGGFSTAFHPQAGCAAVFIYDGVPGGAGFSEQAYLRADELMRITMAAIRRCPCEKGCPACVHSPKCGSGNHPIDKDGAASLLEKLMEPGASPPTGVHVTKRHAPEASFVSPFAAHPKTYGVFDLETQRSAAEVGGWHQAHLMRVSCGVVYDSREDRFVVYEESRIDQLIAHLQRLELVIGFNSKRFDYLVLNGYSDYDFMRLPAFDLWEEVRNRLGFRLSLDHIAEATLGQRKSGSGLDALKWWQAGRMDLIIDYCRKDVLITRDLYLFAREKGYLLYREKDGKKFRIPM
jgi:DEAD/DEAH box helicase domain-containing protein